MAHDAWQQRIDIGERRLHLTRIVALRRVASTVASEMLNARAYDCASRRDRGCRNQAAKLGKPSLGLPKLDELDGCNISRYLVLVFFGGPGLSADWLGACRPSSICVVKGNFLFSLT